MSGFNLNFERLITMIPVKKIFIALALSAFILCGCGGKKTGSNDGSASTKDSAKTTAIKKPEMVDGPYTEKFPSGQVKIEGEIKNGTRFGHWKAFYENGTLQSECYYEDGKLNGKSATFYENGRIRYIGYYKWNEPTGTWEFYDTTGVLANKKEYKN
jgi:antitoxin component YwqK of YwqJK toxin-antitoxin module